MSLPEGAVDVARPHPAASTRRASRRVGAGWLALPGWLVVLALLVGPLGILLAYTLSTSRFFGGLDWTLTAGAVRDVVGDPVVRSSAWSSLRLGLTVALLTLLVSFPTAYIMVFRLSPRARNAVMAMILISLLSNYLIRIYAWRSILGENGILNTGLERAGLIDQPVSWLLYSPTAVVLTLMQVFAPYVVLLLIASLETIPRDLLEAAQDLGSGLAGRLVRIVFPIAAPGIVGALLYTTILTAGDYITPQLVGNGRSLLLGKVIVDRFSLIGDWSAGAALSVFMLLGFLLLWLAVTRATRLVLRWTT